MLGVQLAEHGAERLLQPQQVLFAQEGGVVAAGLQPVYDELARSRSFVQTCANASSFSRMKSRITATASSMS